MNPVHGHEMIMLKKMLKIGMVSEAIKQVVGVMEVVSDYYLDPSDPTGKFGMVDFKALYSLKTPVTLADIKSDERLQELALVRQSQLSVCPIGDDE